MGNYYEWNQAIFQYITAGLPPGSRVFLSIDDEALINAGGLLPDPLSRAERIDDFLTAVRARYVEKSKVKNIHPFGPENNKIPRYLSFLAATVLAAYRMVEDEEWSQNNYFARLQEVLNISTSHRRPKNFEAGVEDGLWTHWGNWLLSHGYLPTAERGDGSWKYIQYPISQTLLRQTDRKNIWRHFTQRQWSRNLEEGVVIARILREKQYLSSHVKSLLSEQSMRPARKQGLHQAIYDVYDLWTNIGGGNKGNYEQIVETGQARNLTAGLYRTFDYFRGEPEYTILPRQPRRMQIEHSRISYDNYDYYLNPLRPGWYQPLWDITTTELNHGQKTAINDVEELNELVLPRREFWILTPDPDDPNSGIYASWGKPVIGVPFIILCKPEVQAQLERLRTQELIHWQEEPKPVGSDGSWYEYQDVMIISSGWGAMIFDDDDLLESLQPNQPITISLSKGLRASEGWLLNYGPLVTINAFEKEATLTIIDPLTNDVLSTFNGVETNKAFKPDWPEKAGSYLISAETSNGESEHAITLIEWNTLQAAQLDNYPNIPAGSATISGGFIKVS